MKRSLLNKMRVARKKFNYRKARRLGFRAYGTYHGARYGAVIGMGIGSFSPIGPYAGTFGGMAVGGAAGYYVGDGVATVADGLEDYLYDDGPYISLRK